MTEAAASGSARPPGEPLPYGTWPSPLTAGLAASGGPRFGDLVVGRDERGRGIVWFSALRDGAQRVLRSVAGAPAQRVDQVDSARSRVNEYGGGALWCGGETLFWVEDSDQCVHRLSPGDERAVRLTEPSQPARSVRHAAGAVEPGGAWMVLEREIHPGSGLHPLDSVAGGPGGDSSSASGSGAGPAAEPVNELAWLPVAGGEAVSLRSVADFAAAPTLSPDGKALAWLEWHHPSMPWDDAELWAAGIRVSDGAPALIEPRRVAGGRDGGRSGDGVAACLPKWSAAGVLWWCDDREDAWSLRRAPVPGVPGEGGGDTAAAVAGAAGDVGEPRWVAGGSRFAFVGDDVTFASTDGGLDSLSELPGGVGDPEDGGVPGDAGLDGLTWVPLVADAGSTRAVLAGRATEPTSVMVDAGTGSGWVDVDPSAWPTGVDSISVPEPITFPTGPPGGAGERDVAHGLLYRPRLRGHRGPEGELPPLVVRIHGGPTAGARAELSPSIQFWTTRGFAVVEVNYRGSTGFGRSYRRLLQGGWGELEVQDCIAAADHLATARVVDANRCVIRGGSAGGFTALEAVCAPPTESGFRFAAATTLYGVTDLMALAADTHKFEARYLDGLVGPLPAARATYERRSPIRHPERISVPVLVLQGLEDRVVPPEQAQTLVAALEANGVPHEYRTYAGEGHGFRQTATLVDALGAELAFYERVLGLAA